jgi:TonB family protein
VTLLFDVALAATMLFAAGSVATFCLGSASADVRRTIWRAVFTGVAALPVVLAFEPPQAAAQFVAIAAVPSAVRAASRNVADVPWLVLIWAVGFAFVMGRLTAGLAQIRHWAQGAIAGDTADFSAAITVPMTWGVVRPQILLPADARTWSEDARDLVVRHEAAHVASHDWAWQTMARVVTAALWFHPLAWVADCQLRREAERAADDAVLASGANPADYAGELVRVARSMTTMPSATVAAVGMVEQSSLERRVRHVLNRDAGRGPASWVAHITVAAFVGALSISAAAAALQDQPVYKVGDKGLTPPKVTKEERPHYSQSAMDRKVQGDVLLELIVTEKGLPTDIRVLKPLDPDLDRAAMEAALEWRFEPALKDGNPVRVRVHLEIQFELRDNPPS